MRGQQRVQLYLMGSLSATLIAHLMGVHSRPLPCPRSSHLCFILLSADLFWFFQTFGNIRLSLDWPSEKLSQHFSWLLCSLLIWNYTSATQHTYLLQSISEWLFMAAVLLFCIANFFSPSFLIHRAPWLWSQKFQFYLQPSYQQADNPLILVCLYFSWLA